MPSRTKITLDDHQREKPKHQTSFGEIAFDASVYGGVGYLANAAIGLTLAHYGKNKPSSWVFKQSKELEKGFSSVYDMILSNPTKVKAWADLSKDIFFLGMGGWALLIPMKWMEDNKAAIVERIDHMFGTGPKTRESLQEQRDYLASAPQQDYVSLISGRTAAYFGAIGGAIPLMTNINNLPFVEKSYSLNKHMNYMFLKNFKHEFKRFSKPASLVDLTSKEIILAGVSAAITYGGSKLIAFTRHTLKDKDTEQAVETLIDNDEKLSYLFSKQTDEQPKKIINTESTQHNEKLSTHEPSRDAS